MYDFILDRIIHSLTFGHLASDMFFCMLMGIYFGSGRV